jgi:hypothetical protein
MEDPRALLYRYSAFCQEVDAGMAKLVYRIYRGYNLQEFYRSAKSSERRAIRTNAIGNRWSFYGANSFQRTDMSPW